MVEQAFGDFDAQYAGALTALEERDESAALAASRQLVELYPDDARSHVLRARALVAFGRSEEALTLLRQGLPMHLGNPKALALLRTLAANCGEVEEAVGVARMIAAIAPLDRKNLAFLVAQHLRAKNLQEALSASEALLKVGEDEPAVWLLRAEALAAAGRAKDGLRALRAGLAHHPMSYPLLKAARNAAIDRERPREAIEYARRMLLVQPGDRKNMAALIQLLMRGAAFAEASSLAEEMIALAPLESDGIVLRAQSLAAQNQVSPALAMLRDALAAAPRDTRLLVAARNLSFYHGRFTDACDYGLRLQDLGHTDKKSLEFIAQSLSAMGDIAAANRFVETTKATAGAPVLKMAHHLTNLRKLEDISPTIVEAWHAAMTNPVETRESTAFNDAGAALDATMIQYWSQGQPPEDVRLVLAAWQDLFERENLGRVKLFDRETAATWIEANSPEFSGLFASAFHYAMESDIFRIAYASKRRCIYVDVDGWPLEHSANILRFGVRSMKSMLYFRSYRPWIVNGFFIAQPDCPFFKLLAEQALSVDLAAMAKDHDTIERSFGPTRYNAVLVDLLARGEGGRVAGVKGVAGCSELSTQNGSILFSHEAAAASVRPPFRLGYKLTGDYWKGISISK